MSKNINKYINKFLLLTTIILVIFILIIIIFYLKEKNTFVQKYLINIQERINITKHSTIVNPKCKVIPENNVIIINNFLNNDYFIKLRKLFDDKKYTTNNFSISEYSNFYLICQLHILRHLHLIQLLFLGRV